MTISFPGSLDNFTNPTSASPINSPSHADQHANANDAIEALEAKVGVDGSTVATSHDYKIAQLESLVTSAVAGAKSIYQDVRNQSGSAFTKATPVYVSGSTGASGQLLVSAASNATEATSSKTMGITTSAISNNSNGQVISEGILEGIDTTGAADGDPVWLGVDGAKIYGLANKPSAPAHLVFLGIVIRGGQANTGSMYVKIQNGFELHELHNVEISSLINGNILTYDSTTQTWKNTNTIQSTSSTIPLVVKASTSQSVAMQQWQDSAGTIHSEIRNSGQFRNQAGAILGNRNGSTLGVLTLYNNNAAVIPLVVQAAASQTANLQEWQHNNGTVLSLIRNDGALGVHTIIPIGSNTGTYISIGSAAINFNSRATTTPTVVINASASQTADLQQWQNSSGTILASIGSNGAFYSNVTNSATALLSILQGGTTRFEINQYGQSWNSTSSTFGTYYNTDGGTLPQVSIFPVGASNKGLIIRGYASQTANLQEWQNSAGTNVGFLSPVGALRISSRLSVGNTGIDYGLMSALIGSATTVGFVLRGAASQTANLQEWQNSSGTVLSFIRSDGLIRADAKIQTPTIYGPSATSGTQVNIATAWTFLTNVSTNVGIIIQGSASQTADLQQWQNSSGTVLAKIGSNGKILVNGDNLDNFQSVGSSNTLYNGFTTATNTGSASYVMGTAGSAETLFNVANAFYIYDGIAGAMRFKIMSTGLVGINSYSPAAQLQINSSSASTIGLIVKAAASQTANLQEWQNSAGTVLASIDANGQASFKSTTLTASSSGDSSLTLVAASGQTAPLLTTSGGAQISAGGNYFRAPGIEATYVMNVTSGNLGTIPFIVKGAASQTANLQEWQDSAGTVLAYVAANGHLLTPRLNITNGGNIVDSAGTTPYFAFGSNQIAIYARNAAYKPLVIQGAASQSANLQEWQQSDGTVTSYVGGDGNIFVQNARALFVNSGYIGSASLVTKAAGPTWSGLIVKAATSQTANLQEWQDSSGTILARVNSAGNIYTSGYLTAGVQSPTGTLTVVSKGVSVPVAVIKGAASQTANLQEWQDSSGNIKSKIISDGSIIVGGGSWTKIDSTYGQVAVRTDGVLLGSLTVGTGVGSVIGLVVKGATSQTANLQEWQDVNGTVLSKIKSTGALEISASDSTRALYVNNSNASGYGMIVNASGGRVFQAQVNGTTKFFVDGTGLFRIGLAASAPSGVFHIDMASAGNGSASNLGLTIRSNTSQTQTGDLFQIQDASSNAIFAITPSGAIKGGNSNTISVNTASTVDTVALSSFTSIEYTLSIKQGSKIRSSKVLVHTDGTSVDSTEYGIMEMGGGITGILVTASVSGTDAILQVTITDAATTNATVKLIKTML